MSNRVDSKFLEVVSGQFGKGLLVDMIGDEILYVLAKSLLFQPLADIEHHAAPVRDGNAVELAMSWILSLDSSSSSYAIPAKTRTNLS